MSAEKYIEASREVRRLHIEEYNDADLVRSGAEQHGVNVVEGSIFSRMSAGNYNPRLPLGTESEASQFRGAEKLLVVCEDYRQSEDVASDPKLGIMQVVDAVFATAGADTQPDEDRFEADVAWIIAVIDLNPSIAVILTHHIGVCGGANYFTKGEMAKTRARSVQEEIEAMNKYGRGMYERIVQDRPEANVSSYLVMVDEHDEYGGLVRQ